MPNVRCYVRGCKNQVAFSFPKKRRREWLEAIGRPEDNPAKHNGLCSSHFRPDDFLICGFESGVLLTRRRLKRYALPSLNLPDVKPNRKLRQNLSNEVGFSDSLNCSISNASFVDRGGTLLPTSECDGSGDLKDSSVTHVVDAQGSEPNDSNSDSDSTVNVQCNEPGYIATDFCDLVMECSDTDDIKPDINSDELVANQYDFVSEVGNVEAEVKVEIGEYEIEVDKKEVDIDKVKVEVDEVKIEVAKVEDGKVSENVTLDSSHGVSKGLSTSEEKILKKKTLYLKQRYDIHDYRDQPRAVKYFTGLDSYSKFISVLQTLRPDLNDITYRNKKVTRLSIENQFFLTLWKLKRNAPDFELGLHFGVCQATVSNIFVSFINFMAEQWGEIDITLTRSLTDFYMPHYFKKAHSPTKVVIDRTGLPVSGLHNPGNLKRKDRLSDVVTLEDLKLAREKAHVERLIGLTKIYQIVTSELNKFYLPIASEIFFVCVMLCNFRESIVPVCTSC